MTPIPAVKRAVIIRGLPGSGKSTLAALMQPDPDHVHNTDHYFMVAGEYKFVPDLLGDYHERNFRAFCHDIILGVPLVVAENTNTRLWEYERYLKVARDNDYQVTVVTVGNPKDVLQQLQCVQRNTHGVPAEAIYRMADRWEQ